LVKLPERLPGRLPLTLLLRLCATTAAAPMAGLMRERPAGPGLSLATLGTLVARLQAG
jgi:hypothetical protein